MNPAFESAGRGGDSRLVVTLGVFDGVHLGHQFLIRTTQEAAHEAGARSRVLTFDPHPAMVLAPGRVLNLLSPLREKLESIAALGVDEVGVVPFDHELSRLEPEEFLSRIVDVDGTLVHLVIGHDFALGRDRSGDATRLTRIGETAGFRVTRVPALRVDGDVVSSSRIRQSLAGGDMLRVARLLGRAYALHGSVVAGDARGRQIGFPTANLRLPPDKTPPPHGVYAVRVTTRDGGDSERPKIVDHPAVMNFGRRPTFGGGDPIGEVHLLDFSGDLLGRELEVELTARIREERQFPDVTALVARIQVDVEVARRLLAGADIPAGEG